MAPRRLSIRYTSGIAERVRNPGVGRRRSIQARRQEIGGERYGFRHFSSRPAASAPWHGPCSDARKTHMNALDILCIALAETGEPRAAAGGGRDRTALRLPDHELHGRHVDRGGGPHRVRSSRDPQHEPGAKRARRTSWSGSSKASTGCSRASSARTWSGRRSGSLPASSSSSSRPTGPLCFRESARSDGDIRRRMASSSISRCSAAPTPIST